MDWYPLWNSLRIALISCAAVFFLGIFAAYYIAKLPRTVKGVLDVVLTLPMVLPPTVVGYFLLLLFGAKRPLGIFFMEHFGVKLVMNWYSAIFASIVVAFPLMYRTARGAFESFDETLAWSAQTLGQSNAWIFWRVRMPCCRQGILAGTVLAFARAGYNVAFTYNSHPDAADAVRRQAEEINPGGLYLAIRADAGDPAQVRTAVARAEQELGSLQVLVCNAGIAQVKLFTDTTDEDWRRMMAVDLDGAFYACRAVLPGMIHRKYGRILLVSSMWGQTGGSCEVAYSAAKAGLIGLGKALAKEEGPSGITVNVIAPGVINTDMMAGFTDEDRAALAEETPVERLGEPDEIARTMVFLADEASGYITGQVLGVNGGLVI